MLQTIAGRALLALLSLSLSVLLFRAQIADALIVRGDDMLVRNSYAAAADRYRRALWLDPDSVTAVDRLAFVALQQPAPKALRAAAAIASDYLATNPADHTVVFDRALCYLKLRSYGEAYADFLRSAQLSGDPQEYAFAGWAARRSGSLRRAVRAWREALRIRPGYRPALVALSESR